MLASSVNHGPHVLPVPTHRSLLLLVGDVVERLTALQAAIGNAGFEIKLVNSLDDLQRACREKIDVIVLDVCPSKIRSMLKLIRKSTGREETPVLVESTRINNNRSLAGVLPAYRAMPCSQTEMLLLLRQHQKTNNQRQARRGML